MHNKVKSLKATGLKIADNPEIKKGRSNSGRACFYIDAQYALEDGTLNDIRIDAERKKNLPRAIEQEKASVAAGSVTAELWSDGDAKRDYWMHCTRFTIGASGLQPFAGHKDSGIPAKPSQDSQAGAGIHLSDAINRSNEKNWPSGLDVATAGVEEDGSRVESSGAFARRSHANAMQLE